MHSISARASLRSASISDLSWVSLDDTDSTSLCRSSVDAESRASQTVNVAGSLDGVADGCEGDCADGCERVCEGGCETGCEEDCEWRGDRGFL